MHSLEMHAVLQSYIYTYIGAHMYLQRLIHIHYKAMARLILGFSSNDHYTEVHSGRLILNHNLDP